ncbi:MAG: hypothetical protein OEL89_00635 [Candidatus Peregrinibacteria bacterium]|nr:hypothetical protein [Candidatus Peregrinibacteria bacterium]
MSSSNQTDESKVNYPVPPGILSPIELKSIRETNILNKLQDQQISVHKDVNQKIIRENSKGLTRLYIDDKLDPNVKFRLRQKGYVVSKDVSNKCLSKKNIKRYIDWSNILVDSIQETLNSVNLD